MSHITKEQLQHLAKLCRIQLSTEDETELLPQLEKILDFVGQLEKVDVTGFELENISWDDVQHVTRSGVVDSEFSEKFLSNIQHKVTDRSLTITWNLSEH